MNTVTGQDIHDSIFLDDANGKALDGLLLALAEGQEDEADEFLSVLRKAAKSAMYELSGEKEFDDWKEGIEHADYVASVHHSAMM
jgi:hypothetical protein